MRQALHILKKDARHLRREIALLLLLVIVFAVLDAHPQSEIGRRAEPERVLRLLLLVAWFLLIARVIQSDALPGDKQFWITRPYSWKSLLAAKVLFIVAFLTLPMTIADAAIVTVQGFSVTQHFSGLILLQILRFAQIFLTMAALAAITGSLRRLVLWAVASVAIGLAFSDLAQAYFSEWGTLGWISNSITSAFTVPALSAVVIWQYARRRSWAATAAVIAVMVLASLTCFLPSSIGDALQHRFAKNRVDDSSVIVARDPESRPSIAPLRSDVMRVAFPLRVAGVPAGLTARHDSSQVHIEDAQGRTIWRSDPISNTDRASVFERDGLFSLHVEMSRSFFERIKSQPLRLRTLLLIALYGDAKSITLPPRTHGFPVPSLGLCDTDLPAPYLCWCRAPFQIPHLRVAGPENGGMVSTPQSPYPADLGISPMENFAIFLFQPRRPGEVPPPATITTEEPMAHLRRELTLDNIRMADFERN